MISALSSAGAGLQIATARFNSAASNVVASSDPDIAEGVTDMSTAMVGMIVAQYALMASLKTAQVSNDMMGDMLRTYR